MVINFFSWTQCDSLYDLENRLATLRGVSLLPFLATKDANTWGVFKILCDDPVALPVGYSDIGLTPNVALANGVVLVGINELVTGIDLSTGDFAFRYRMPSIFHRFVRVDQAGALIQDEIGFVLLSSTGEELWIYNVGLINEYKLIGEELVGTTFEGEPFRVAVVCQNSSTWDSAR